MNHLSEFNYFFQKQQYSKACSVLAPLIVSKKVSPEIVHQYAYALRMSNQVQAAKDIYTKYLRHYRKHPLLLNGLGNVMMQAGETESAIEQFKIAHKHAPSYFDAVYNLARAHLSAENYGFAKQYYQTALSLKPNHLNTLIGLSSALNKLNETENAEKILSDILHSQPNNIVALNNLGNLYRDSNNLEKSISCFETAYRLASNNPDVVRNFAACLHQSKYEMRAAKIYEMHIEQFIQHVGFQKDYANFRWLLNYEDPFLFVEKGIQADSKNVALLFMYINLLQKLEKYEKAISLISPLFESQTDNAELCSMMSGLYLGVGEIQRSLELSEKAIKMTKNPDVSMLNQYGYSLLASQEFSQSLQVYENLIQFEPNNQAWWALFSSSLRHAQPNQEQYAQLNDYKNLVQSANVRDRLERAYNGDFFQDLIRDLNTLHTSSQFPVEQTLRNGTQTFEDLFIHDLSSLKLLKDIIRSSASDFLSGLTPHDEHPFLKHLPCDLRFNNSWSVKLKNNGFHKSHFHSEGWLSGVFYVEVPDAVNEDGQGWLQFGKAEVPGLTDFYDYAVKPEKGLLVLFPSFMWHGTIPFHSDGTRLTVVVDIAPNKQSEG